MSQRLKILLLLEASGGGTGRHVADLASGLSSRGHDVHLIYSPLRIDGSFERFLSSAESINCVELPMSRGPSLQDCAAISWLRAYIRKKGPFDVLHGHSSKAGALVRLLGNPKGAQEAIRVYTPHALVTMNPLISPRERWLYSRLERLLAQRSDRIIAVSEEEYRHAVELGIDQRRLCVVHNGIPPMTFPERRRVRASLGLRDSEVCIGFVGRLVSQKAPEVLIQAFHFLRKSGCSNARLVLVGSGDLETQVRRQAEELEVDSEILWLGHREAQEVLSAFDVFVLPSRYEGFPYVLLEAMAAKLPLVSTDVGGARAVIKPGRNGFIVASDNPRELSARLIELVSDSKLRVQMGEYSANMIVDFSAERMVEATLELYNQLVERRRANIRRN